MGTPLMVRISRQRVTEGTVMMRPPCYRRRSQTRRRTLLSGTVPLPPSNPSPGTSKYTKHYRQFQVWNFYFYVTFSAILCLSRDSPVVISGGNCTQRKPPPNDRSLVTSSLFRHQISEFFEDSDLQYTSVHGDML